MLAACKVHVGRVMVENFYTVGSGPTVCCTVTVKAKLGTFAECGRVKMFTRVRARARERDKQQSHSFTPPYNSVSFINNGCSNAMGISH